MEFIDTHTHIYLDDFSPDIETVIQSAKERHVKKMLLPNIDSSTIEKLKELCRKHPDCCFPMMGLHPTSVNKDFEKELLFVEAELSKGRYIAVGEIGIDLYWDKTFKDEQVEAFLFQIKLAEKHKLPIVIHTRDSFSETIEVLQKSGLSSLNGIFHCFSGTLRDAFAATEMGYKLGIGGVITFKRNGLTEIVENINLEHLVLETDAPFLAPYPYRGKRNEPAYLTLIAEKIAEIKNVTLEEVARITTQNAMNIFRL